MCSVGLLTRIPKICAVRDSTEEAVSDIGGVDMVTHDGPYDFRIPLPMVRPSPALHTLLTDLRGDSSSIPAIWPFLAVYMIWIRWIDKSPVTGGRSSVWFRGSRFWKYFADYYPASYVRFCLLGLLPV